MNVGPPDTKLTDFYHTISQAAGKVKDELSTLFQKVQRSKVAGPLRKIGKAAKNPDLPGTGKAAALFRQVFGKSVSEESSIPRVYQEKVNNALDLLQSMRELESEESQEIQQQLAEGFNAISKEMVEDVKNSDKPKYIRATKVSGKSRKAKYEGSHIQINPDGKVYLIPKNPKLWLGKGGFKKVRIAIELDEDLNPKEVVAFASLKISGKAARISMSDVMREVNLVKEFLEPDEKGSVNVQAFDPGKVSKKRGGKAKMVLPYANLGDLEGKKFKGRDQEDVVRGCCKWIRTMHEANYVNRDIKPENFLGFKDEDSPVSVKCMDLGLAGEAGWSTAICGTSGFMPPEMLKRRPYYDGKAADIFSLGATLYCLETGKRNCSFVTNAMSRNDVRRPVMNVLNFRNGWKSFQPVTKLQLLAKEMMNPNPALRPNIDQVSIFLESVYNDDVPFGQFQNVLVNNAVEGLRHNTTESSHEKLQRTGDMMIRESSQSTPEKPVFTLDIRTAGGKRSLRFEITEDNQILVTSLEPPKSFETMEALIESIGGQSFIQPLEKEVQALCHNTTEPSYDKLTDTGDMLIRMSRRGTPEKPIYTLDFKGSSMSDSCRFEITEDNQILVTFPGMPKLYDTLDDLRKSVGGKRFIKPEE